MFEDKTEKSNGLQNQEGSKCLHQYAVEVRIVCVNKLLSNFNERSSSTVKQKVVPLPVNAKSKLSLCSI